MLAKFAHAINDESLSEANDRAQQARHAQLIENLIAVALDLASIVPPRPLRARIVESVRPMLAQDLSAMRRRDPAVRFKPIECLLSVHSTFFAILCYRLAHLLTSLKSASDDLVIDAMNLSYAARSLTGVEIHPDARIGQRLAIDHGWGTIIGQTVEIGDDAYILNNVLLGGREVGDASDGKRHPTIGHRVQISGGVRILGPVVIGDDCFLGPEVTITKDVPAHSRVVLKRGSNVATRAPIQFRPTAARSHETAS